MAFCSACDRPVPVALKPHAAPHERPSVQDAEDLVCLDYGRRCTGALCPLFSVPDAPPRAPRAEPGRHP